jgi:HSP20 family molecular chaperone IbpA
MSYNPRTQFSVQAKVEKGTLLLHGQPTECKYGDDLKKIHCERRQASSFSRSIALPEDVDQQKISAKVRFYSTNVGTLLASSLMTRSD